MNAKAQETITRSFAAPAQLVWDVLTSAAGINSWFGPRGFTAAVDALDFRPGGAFTYTMTATDPQMIARMEKSGRPTCWPASAVFTAVNPITDFAYTLSMPMGPDKTVALLHTFTLTPTDDGVELVLVLEAEAAEFIQGAAMGYKSSFGRLEEVVAAAVAG